MKPVRSKSRAKVSRRVPRTSRFWSYSVLIGAGLAFFSIIFAIITAITNGDPSVAATGQNYTASAIETLVNTTTTTAQVSYSVNNQAIASDDAGNYVIVWGSLQNGAEDIYGQRFNAQGVPQGGEFLINTVTAGTQTVANVAMDSDGDFVVTWRGTDASSFGIKAQRFNAAGVAQGAEFQVNTTTASQQISPAVAMDSDGDFIIVWYSIHSGAADVYAQRYDAAGVAQGGEFLVNTVTAGEQAYGQPGMADDGSFVITWTAGNNLDGSGYGVYAQRYDSAGVAQGGNFLVNTTTANDQIYRPIDVDASGNFVIAWSSNLQDGSGYGIYFQRFAADGTFLGSETQANQTTSGNQLEPRVTMEDDGKFLVAWDSALQDGSSTGSYLRSYDASGVPLGDEIQLNSTTTGAQGYPSMAITGTGRFVAVWSGNGPGDSDGVFQRTFNLVSSTTSSSGSGGAIVPDSVIELTYPVGGETLEPGTDETITWTSEAFENYVNLSASYDGGQTYDSLVMNTPNDGSWDWHVPERPSDDVTVRIALTDLVTETTTDVSAPFVVKSPSALPDEPVSDPDVEDEVTPGTFIRSESAPEVYYVDGNSVRHLIFNEAIFFTYEDSWDNVQIVSQEAIDGLRRGPIMLPNAEVVLVKIVSVPNVYAVFEEGEFTGLRLLQTEAIAAEMYGANWADYVIDLPPTFWARFLIGEVIHRPEPVDTEHLKRRDDLHI